MLVSMVGSSGSVLGLGKLSLPRAEQPREPAGRQGGSCKM